MQHCRHLIRPLAHRCERPIPSICQRNHLCKYSTISSPAYLPAPKRSSSPIPSSPSIERATKLAKLFQREAPSWVTKVGVRQRLLRFGIPQHELPGLLTAFTRDIQNGGALTFREKRPAQLTKLFHDITSPSKQLAIDQALTSFLYAWATD